MTALYYVLGVLAGILLILVALAVLQVLFGLHPTVGIGSSPTTSTHP